jgi:hypothetical protein
MRKWIYLCSAIAAVVVGVAVGVMEASSQPAVRRTSQLEASAPAISKATSVSAREVSGRCEPNAPWCPARLPRARTTVVIAIDPSPPYFSRRCCYVLAGRHLIIKIHDPGFKLHGLVISPWSRPAFFLYNGEAVVRIGATTIGPPRNLDYQEQLTRMLLGARPVYEQPGRDWAEILELETRAPVVLSYGPTAADKTGPGPADICDLAA